MNRVVVGAHYGLRDWLIQRISAVVLALYTIFLLFALITSSGEYSRWHDLMSCGLVRFFTFITVVCLCYHAWVGIRDIWMDYIQSAAIRLTVHALTALLLIGYGGWAAQILMKLAK